MNVNKSSLDKIRIKHNLSLILLHGSQVDEKLHKKSDIDIAVTKKSEQKLNLLALIKDLANTLGTDSVDLSDITHAEPLFLFSVARNSRLLSGSVADHDSLIRLAFHKYSDYLPYLKKEKEYVEKRIKSYVTN